MPENLWCLKHCSLFRRLPPAKLARLEARSRVRTFSPGDTIRLPGEVGDSVFLLARGLVKICHFTPDGKESILAFVEMGELFGEQAIVQQEQSDECIQAVDCSTVVMIPTAEIQQLVHERSDVALAVTKLVGLRRQRIQRRLSHLLFLSNRQRLIHLLLDLAEQFGWEADNGIRLSIRLSHQDLANLIGSTRETVTVLLGQLKAEGCVGGGRRRIVLTDPVCLAQSVHRRPPRPESSALPKPWRQPALMSG